MRKTKENYDVDDAKELRYIPGRILWSPARTREESFYTHDYSKSLLAPGVPCILGYTFFFEYRVAIYALRFVLQIDYRGTCFFFFSFSLHAIHLGQTPAGGEEKVPK